MMTLANMIGLLVEAGRFPAAEEAFADFERRCADASGTRPLRCGAGLLHSARLRLAQGRLEQAAELVDQARRAFERAAPVPAERRYGVAQLAAEIALAGRRLPDAAAALRDAEPLLASLPKAPGYDRMRARHALLVARLALARGEAAVALDRAQSAGKQVRAALGARHWRVIETDLEEARALEALGRPADAAARRAAAATLAAELLEPGHPLRAGAGGGTAAAR
jgi:hypothetical protein